MPFNTTVDFEVQDFRYHAQQKPVMLSCRCLGDFTEGVVMFTPFTVCFTLLSSSCTQSVGTKACKVLLFLSLSAFYNTSPLPRCSKHALKKRFFYVFFFFFFLPLRVTSSIVSQAPLSTDTLDDVHLGLGLVNSRRETPWCLLIENTALNHSITSIYESLRL